MSSTGNARRGRAKVAYELTQEEDARRDGLVARLGELREGVEGALETFAEKLDEAWAPVKDAVSAYNEVLSEARGFAEDVASLRREAFDGRSERWRESDEGERAGSWVEEWERAEFPELELERPEAPEAEGLSDDETLGGLPRDSED